MRRIASTSLVLAIAFLAGSGGLLAQVPDQPASTTTPDVLAWQAPGVAAAPDTYGLVSESSFYVGESGFTAIRPNVVVNEDGGGSAYFVGTCTDCASWAPVHLPQGALITGIDFYYYDTNATTNFFCVLYRFPSNGSFSSVASVTSTGSAGWGTATYNLPSPATVDNSTGSYSMFVFYSAASAQTNLKWRGARVRYKLQVSPAPGVASFTDVPTSYWAFQYIEALKASGITGGITPTTFEPESPVTRAQMAVFLAKALGLHWPN